MSVKFRLIMNCMPILLIAWIPVNMIIILSAKPSAGIIWNAIRAALRWPLRIIGIIMFIMGTYVYNDVHEYTVNNIILWQVCSALFIIAGFIAFMLAGRKRIKTMLEKPHR